MPKAVPLDTSSFRRIRLENKLYVDKTKWIYKMITEGICYFLSRPRRFGKSLTVSTLKELFSGNKELFKGLYIYDKWEFEKYPIILFDFNGIPIENREKLETGLRDELFSIAKIEEIELSEREIVRLLRELILNLYEKYQKFVVVLVDEYDKPIVEHLGKAEEGIKRAIENRELLENFFGVLKEASVVDVLKFVFVTGVSAFAKVSIFSKWNNLTNLTINPKYADFLGYTEEEIFNYFGEHLKEFCQIQGFKNVDECMERIRYWYNGYRFSPWRDVRVYNPVSVMNTLKEGYFSNWWFETGTPSFLVNLLKEKNYYIPQLEELEVTEEFVSAFEIEDIPIEALLFQAGYLSIKEVEGRFIKLGYPNIEVKTSFSEVLLSKVYKAGPRTKKLAEELGKALIREDWGEVKEIFNQILAQIPYPLYGKADEKFFHTVFYLCLNLLGYDARAEVLSSRGRCDVALTYKGKAFVMEFKAGEAAESALKQIEEKGYAKKFISCGYKKVIKLGISFDIEKREVVEIVTSF
ncbi:AAA family ATPase [Desulfonauticus submarinus]